MSDADAEPLEKPTLPKRPPRPDLRYVKDEVVKMARLQQHVADLMEWDELKKRYERTTMNSTRRTTQSRCGD